MTDTKMDKEFDDVPLSQSNVTMKLADIQRRCSQLMEEDEEELGLTLEDPPAEKADDSNPYDRG